MQSDERDHLRQVFFDCWNKHKNQLPLSPLEANLLDIILSHPEYHSILENTENLQTNTFSEQNPFLHLSLHLALQEQIQTDRPSGIQQIYLTLCKKNSIHDIEHKMMDCLGEMLWNAQQSGVMPDEKNYLTLLNKI